MALTQPQAFERIIDLGCGTGNAAPPSRSKPPPGARVDRNAWAVAEANWTYKVLGLRGRATAGTIQREKVPRAPGVAILAAYTINELPDTDRDVVLRKFAEAHKTGAQILIAEPIARRMNRWWDDWRTRSTRAKTNGAFASTCRHGKSSSQRGLASTSKS